MQKYDIYDSHKRVERELNKIEKITDSTNGF